MGTDFMKTLPKPGSIPAISTIVSKPYNNAKFVHYTNVDNGVQSTAGSNQNITSIDLHRLRIQILLTIVKQGTISIADLSATLLQPVECISKQITILRAANLVSAIRTARKLLFSLSKLFVDAHLNTISNPTIRPKKISNLLHNKFNDEDENVEIKILSYHLQKFYSANTGSQFYNVLF
jgi:hypothetical protein